MTKLQSWLSGILAVQLVLAGVLLWNGYQSNNSDEAEKLFDLAASDIDRVVISDGDNTAALAKEEGRWVLPDKSNLPATESKISSTLTSLGEIDLVWPVSTTASSHKRFEVEDDNYQREIKVYHGEELIAQLFIGTSPGFRKVHVRRSGDDEVYAVALNSFDFPATVDDWLDKGLLTVSAVDHIVAPSFTLKKADDIWQFEKDANSGEGEVPTINTEKAQQLATAFSNFRVQGIIDSAPESDAALFEVSAGAEKYRFNFYHQDEVYAVQREDRDWIFTLSKYDYERLAGVKRENLIVEAPSNNDTNPIAVEDAESSTETSK